MKAANPEMKNADIARELGISRSAVTQMLSKNAKLNNSPRVAIWMTKDPAKTAANIVAKMGEEYAITADATGIPQATYRLAGGCWTGFRDQYRGAWGR